MASIYVEAQSSSSILAYLYNLSTVGESGRTVEWYLNDEYEGSASLSSSASTTNNFYFNNLAPSTTYKITGKITIDGYVVESKSTTCTTSSYSGGDSGGDTTTEEWSVAFYNSRLNYSETETFNYSLYPGDVVRIAIKFANSGMAKFYSTSGVDTIGFLSSSSSFNTSTGRPSNVLTSHDGNTDFSFEYAVTAGTQYYLFVRCYYATVHGYIPITIEPPGSSGDSGDSSSDTWIAYNYGSQANISSTFQKSMSISNGKLCYMTVSFANAGEATFYSSGSADIVGYLSNIENFDTTNGRPKYILAQDDDSGTNYNFSFTYKVEANLGYYICLRNHSVSASSDTTLCIEPPAGEDVNIGGASISKVEATGTTITVRVDGLDSSYSRNDRTITWYIDGSEKDTVSLGAYVSQSGTYQFTGLKPSTSYTIGASIYYTSNGVGATKILDNVPMSTANWATSQKSGLGTVSSSKTASWTLSAATICYASVKFSKSGTVTFYSTGSTDTRGYLSTSTPFDNTNGYPSSILAEDDDSNGNYNFKFTYAVSASTTYYIWVRGYDTGTTGSTTLNIEYSDIPDTPSVFEWSAVKQQGGEFNLTATEWKNLQTKVNEVRTYLRSKYNNASITQWPNGTLSQGTSVFTSPTSGDVFTATHYNQVLMAIAGAYSELGTPNVYNSWAVKQGDTITASCINKLVSLVNDLIDM